MQMPRSKAHHRSSTWRVGRWPWPKGLHQKKLRPLSRDASLSLHLHLASDQAIRLLLGVHIHVCIGGLQEGCKTVIDSGRRQAGLVGRLAGRNLVARHGQECADGASDLCGAARQRARRHAHAWAAGSFACRSSVARAQPKPFRPCLALPGPAGAAPWLSCSAPP